MSVHVVRAWRVARALNRAGDVGVDDEGGSTMTTHEIVITALAVGVVAYFIAQLISELMERK